MRAALLLDIAEHFLRRVFVEAAELGRERPFELAYELTGCRNTRSGDE